uniref:phenylalanine N-monooxygenase-like n=1 Tax=Erigeron canadensis TaxID=72917 RepID=UPI001CB94F96|nr:phenylalanine N-monooxygenase-like [Erigeron canadensis]
MGESNKREGCTSSNLRPLLPPGPKPFPYIGCLITMLRNKPTFQWIHRMMDDMNTNILCVRLGNVHVIVVSDPKIACEFLKDKDRMFSSRPDCVSGYLTSGGYLNASLAPMGDHWKKMRKVLATDILSMARHEWLQNKRDKEVNNLLRYGKICKLNYLLYVFDVFLIRHVFKLTIIPFHFLTKLSQCMYLLGTFTLNARPGVVSGRVVNVRVIVQQHSINIIRKIIFGSRYFGKGDAYGGHGQEVVEHFDSLSTIAGHVYAFCVTDYFPWLGWITDFDGHERNLKNALCIAKKYLDPLVDERIQQWNNDIKTKEDDLLDVFINLQNPRLSVDQIKAQILDFFLATFDNIPNNIEWTLAEMISNPRILEKAVHEIDSLVGKDHRLVQETDLVHLRYIKSCVREAFRLHPVAPFNLPHVASEDTIAAGYFIPKGSHVLLSRPGLGRNAKVWNDPLTFNPDRHINGQNEVVLTDHDLNMLSFSTGRRGCPGVLLGTTITVMLMARLVQGFTWELPPNEPHVDLKENMHNLWKAKPLLALAKPRLPHHLYPTC